MRSMKRVLSLLLVLAMVFAMVPSFAMATESGSLSLNDGNVAENGLYETGGEKLSLMSLSRDAFVQDTTYSNAVSFIAEDGTETVYNVGNGEGQYARAELAMSAAYTAWKTAKKGTIKLYADVAITDTALFNGGNYVFLVASGNRLIMDLNGHSITYGDGTTVPTSSSGNPNMLGIAYPSTIDTYLEVCNGTIKWAGSRALFCDGGSSETNDASKSKATLKMVNMNVDTTGAARMFYFNGAAGSQIILDGGVYKDEQCKYGFFTPTNETSKNKIHVLGGAELWAVISKDTHPLRFFPGNTLVMEEGVKVYFPNAEGKTGFYFIENCTDAYLLDETTGKLYGVENGTEGHPFGSATVYCNTVTLEGENLQKVIGVVDANGVETAYLVRETLQAPIGNIYPNEVSAVNAAFNAGAAYVKLYKNLETTATINVTASAMTLNTNGYTVSTTADALFTAKADTVITLDGGVYNLGSGLAAKGANGASIDVVYKNGVEINTSAAYSADVGTDGTLYLGESVVYTADNSNGTLDKGLGIIVPGKGTVTLGLPEGGRITPNGVINTQSKTYNGATVYKKAFAAKYDTVKAAGFTPAGGAETLYYVNEGLSEAETATNTYPSAEDAFEAAWTAAQAADGAVEVDVYTDLAFTRSFSNGTNVLSTTNTDTTLDLNGCTLSRDENGLDANGKGLALVSVSGARNLTIANGTIVWDPVARSVVPVGTSSDHSFTGTLTFKDVNYVNDAGTQPFIAQNGNGGAVIFDGGSYEMLNQGLCLIRITNDAYENPDSATTITLTGGVEIKTTSSRAVVVGTQGRVYLHDAAVYTYSQNVSAENGYGVAKIANPEGSGEVAVNVTTTLGNAAGDASRVVSLDEEFISYNGATVYLKEFAPIASGDEGGEGGEGDTPTPEAPDYTQGVDIAGVKGNAADAVETIYGVVLKSSDNKYYTYSYTAGGTKDVTNTTGTGARDEAAGVENAFEAASTAWHTAKKAALTLYADVTTDAQKTVAGTTVSNAYELILNLNGKTLSENAGSTVTHFAQLARYATLTVNGGNGAAGTGKVVWSDNFIGLAADASAVIFNGVTLDCGNTTAIQIKAKNTGSVTFNGGSVKASNLFSLDAANTTAARNIHQATTAVSLKNGFAFTSNSECAVLLPPNAPLTVGDATFTLGSTAATAESGYIIRNKTSATADETVAGTFTKDPATLLHVVSADGSKNVHKFVDASSMVAEFNGTKYLTLNEAIAALKAAEGGTLKLLKDANLTTTGDFALDVDFGFTLDLNGKTLTTTGNGIGFFNGMTEGEYAIQPAAKKIVNIISTGAEGKIVSGDIYAVYNAYGDVTVDNVVFEIDETNIGAYYIDGEGKSVAFYTAEDAVDRLMMKKGGTVKLMKDVAFTGADFAIKTDFGFTLDLNGYDMTTSGSAISVFAGLTAEEYAALSAEQKAVNIISTGEKSKIVAGGIYGVYTAYGEANIDNVDVIANGVVAFTYTSGDGSKTLDVMHLAEAFAALEADATATNATHGTITQLADYVVDENSPAMNSGALIHRLTKDFVWDMNGYSVKAATGYTASGYFMQFGTSAADDPDGVTAEIKNGSISWKSSTRLIGIGSSGSDAIADLTLTNMNLHNEGHSTIYINTPNAVMTIDGGSVISDSQTSDRTITVVKDGTDVYLKGGVLVEKHGVHTYPLHCDGSSQVAFYLQDVVFGSYNGNPCNSSNAAIVVALLDANGNVIDLGGAAPSTKFTSFTISPSVYTDEGYTESYLRLVYTSESIGDTSNENAVVKSSKTGLVYTAEDLQKYLNSANYSGDTLTVLKNFPGADDALTQLRFGQAATLDLAGFAVSANITATADITVKNGTVNGDISGKSLTVEKAVVNGAVSATNLTASASTINGAVTVNGGVLNIENTNVTAAGAAITIVNAPVSHYIAGGKVTTGAPVVVPVGATLFVTGGTELTASGSNAIAEISGAMLLKEAVVKFKNGVTPFDEAKVEGYRAPNSDVVGETYTTWTYVLEGNTDKTGMKAMLVETGMYFETVAEALSAASTLASETVKLIASDSVGAYTFDRDVTLDLGGYVLTGNLTVNGDNVAIYNGTVAATSGAAVTVLAGQIDLNGATLVSSDDALIVDGATATVNVSSSKLYGNTAQNNVGYALNVKNAASVTVKDTVIASADADMKGIAVADGVAYGTVELVSGSIMISAALPNVNEWADGQDNISTVISGISRYAENHLILNPANAEESNNAFFVLSVSAPAATIGRAGYATFREAVAAAGNTTGATIVLQRDVDLDDAAEMEIGTTGVIIKKSMVIDLNGFTLDGMASSVYHQVTGGTVTIKNGTITNLETSANYTFMVGNGATLRIENVNAHVKTGFINTATSTSTARVEVSGGTLISVKPPQTIVGANQHGSNSRDLNPVMVLTGGVKLIREDGKSPLVGAYTRYQIDDAYIYYTGESDGLSHTYGPAGVREEGTSGPIETAHFAAANVQVETLTDTYNGTAYNVSHFYTGAVAYIDTETNTFNSVDAAIAAAAGNVNANTIYLLPGAKINNESALAANDTLVLNGNDLVFGTTGKLEVSGTLVPGSKNVAADGNLVFKAGSKVALEGGAYYTFDAEKAVKSELTLQKMSLTLNDKVDMNLKFSLSTVSGIIGNASVKVNGVSVLADAENKDLFVVEDIAVSDYDTAYWVVAEAAMADGAYVGMPKAVSIYDYAKRAIETTGVTSNLSYAMSALLTFSGDFGEMDKIHPENTSDYDITSRDVATAGSEISVVDDLANGFGLVFNVNAPAAGKLTVSHMDIYGATFEETFDVASGSSVVSYTKIHMADYNQKVTATLTVDGTVVATLETSLGMVIGGNDNAIIASGLARKYFGK